MHNQLREPQHYEDCQAKSIQEFGWTSQGMDWGWGQVIKSTTHRRVEEFGYSCHQRRLTWAKKKKNWTVAQWSKVLFSDESKFCISFGNQGPRVWRKGGEAHSPSCLKSSVKFPQSVMIWGVMSSAGVGPLCFLKTNFTAPVYQEILEHFMLPSADQLFKDADFIFQQDLTPAHTAKSTKSWLNDHGCAWLASKLTRPEQRIYGILSRGIWETGDQKMQMSWRPLSKETWASTPPQQCHKLITSMPRRIEAVIKAKEPLTSIEYIYSKYTYCLEFQLFTKKKKIFGLKKYSNLLRLVGFC